MKRYTLDQIKNNILLPPMEVLHSELRRENEDSLFRSVCPACEEGLLLVLRDNKTHRLLAQDYCISCGRRVIYADIKKMRRELDGENS